MNPLVSPLLPILSGRDALRVSAVGQVAFQRLEKVDDYALFAGRSSC